MSSTVRLLPLGGLGQIGMNCLAIEQDDEILVIDCGTTFPQDDRGVDVLHADFRWLIERSERFRGVVLTHGHEDHVGALPYLLRELPVPVWGPPHALGVAARRLDEHGVAPRRRDLRVLVAGARLGVGAFEVEPVRVSHSIVEATALRLGTRAGVIVHTGDFNFDADPPDGEPSDTARLRQIGDAGVALLLSDSTNIDSAAPGIGERRVGRTLARLIGEAPGRVVVGLFASNIQRLIVLGEIARRTDRKICLLGRSLRNQVAIAQEIGRLPWPSDLLISVELARTLPAASVLWLAGGTQAEQHSGLARLAAGTHSELALGEGDTVLLSSRVIPGNERGVMDMLCALQRRGARVHTRITEPEVHTSGHASRPEQQRMLELLRPRAFLPVHGTLHHLLRHAELAREVGVGQVLVIENGASAVFDGERLREGERFHAGMVAESPRFEPIDAAVLEQRGELGRGGVVAIFVAVGRSGEVLAEPVIHLAGVAGGRAADQGVERVLRQRLRRELGRSAGRGAPGPSLEERVRETARAALRSLATPPPRVLVSVQELDA